MKAQPKASHYINGRFVDDDHGAESVSYTHLTLPTNREV